MLTAVLLLFGREMLLSFGASVNTIDYADSYLKIYALGTIFVQLTLGMNSFITAQGFAQIGMRTVLIGAVCNILLDPVFIFGWFGLPAMGIAGAAVATVIAQGLSAALCLVRMSRDTGEMTRLQWRLLLPSSGPGPAYSKTGCRSGRG